MWAVLLALGIAVLGAPELEAQELRFEPPPGTRLSDTNAFITLTLDISGYSWSNLPWDWQNPRVILDGEDISAAGRSLVAGATAVALNPSQIVVSELVQTPESLTLRLSGLRLSPGFHQVTVEFPAEGRESLVFQANYPVIAGQGQVQTAP